MQGSVLLYDPTAPGGQGTEQARLRLGALAGKVVGFIDNAKPNFNHLVDDLAEELVRKYGVRTVLKRAKRGASMPAPGAIVEELAAQCDLVITGSGD